MAKRSGEHYTSIVLARIVSLYFVFYKKLYCIKVSFFQDTNFINALELAVRFGKTLIIQEMDGVEPVLYPLLRKDLVAQGKFST